MARSLPLSLLVLLCCSRWCTGQECNKAETIEAEEAFKNCVESAQAGIIGRAAKQEPQDSICQALDSMLGVCHRQTELLALCKGSEHAEKVALLHLSATGDIVHSLNRGVDVQKCDAFTKKKATAVKRPSQQQPEMRPRSQPHPEHQPANGDEVLHREWTLLVAVLTAMMLV